MRIISARLIGMLATLLVIAGALTGTPSVAQVTDDAELRSAREALLQKMLADPMDTSLMLDFARASVRLREFEPAISTLERYLDQRPGDISAIYELAVAYFALGAYEVAEIHFRKVADAPGVGPAMQTKVAAYREEIGARSASSGFRGRIEAGLVYSTNAALQSSSESILSFGVPRTRTPGQGPEGAIGASLRVRLDHKLDLDSPDGEFWHSEATLLSTHFFDQTEGDFDGILLRSGPMLALDEFAFGPKIRPYVDVDTFLQAGDWSSSTIGTGLQFHNTFDSAWSVFANGRVGWRFRDTSNANGVVTRGIIGTTWRPERDIRLRLSGILELDRSKRASVRNTLWAVRAGASYDFDTGLEIADRKWRAGSYAQYQDRGFGGPDAAVSPTITRRDRDIRVGANLKANLQDGFFVTTNADWLARVSNIPQFDGRELLLRFAAGLDF